MALAPPWLCWAALGLALLVLLQALVRRLPGGGAFGLAALAVALGLAGPTLNAPAVVERTLLVLEEPGLGASLQGTVKTLQERTGAAVEHWLLGPTPVRLVAGQEPPRPGPPLPWGVLAGLIAAAPGEPLLLAALAGPREGLEGPRMPRDHPAWAEIHSPAPPAPAPAPGLVASLPRRARAGRPCLVVVESGPWPGEGQATLAWRLDGSQPLGPLAGRIDSAGRVRFTLEIDPLTQGTHRLDLELRAGAGAASGCLMLEVRPAPRLAVPEAGLLGRLLETQGFRVEPLRLPIPSEIELVAWDRSPLSPAEAAALEAFLDRGGGLLALGPGLAGLAAWPGLAERLPLLPRPEDPAPEARGEEPGEAPPVAPEARPPAPPPPEAPAKPPEERLAATASLLIVLDVSGSMQRLLPVVVQAARASAQALDPGDRLGLVAFSEEARVVIPMGPVREQVGLLPRLYQEGAQGRTLLWPALDQARRLLEAEPTAVKTVLVFTDGAVEWGSRAWGTGSSMREPESLARLAEDLRRKKISVSGVIYWADEQADLRFSQFRDEGMKRLDTLALHTGGFLHRAASASQVVQVFLAEARRASPEKAPEERPLPRPEEAPPAEKPPVAKRPPAPEPAVRPEPLEVHRAAGGWVVEGLPAALPRLASVVAAAADPDRAWVPLEAGPARRPLLALAPPSLARVGVWAADAGEVHAGPWLEAGLLAPLLARTATALLPPDRPRLALETRSTAGGSGLEVRLPGRPAERPARLALAEAGSDRELPIRWSGPCTFTVPLPEPGAAPVRVRLPAPAGEGWEPELTLPPARPAEALARLETLLGVRPGQAPPPARIELSSRPAGHLLAGVALLLLLLGALRARRGARREE